MTEYAFCPNLFMIVTEYEPLPLIPNTESPYKAIPEKGSLQKEVPCGLLTHETLVHSPGTACFSLHLPNAATL